MRDQVEATNFEHLNEWLEFGDWLLSNPVHNLEDTEDTPDDPRWCSSRETVSTFIEVCLKKLEDLPVSAREHIAKLLEALCMHADRYLDQRAEDNLSESNFIDEAINNPRGRALKDFISFSSWLRRYDSDYEATGLTATLEKRLGPKAKLPLTLPEYAILGMSYNRILYLNKAWATKHKSDIFPKDDLPAWVAAFGSFVGYNRPFKPTFEIIQDDLDFALKFLIDSKTRVSPQDKQSELFGRPSKLNNAEEKLKECIGQHLFHYYLWGLYPLRGLEMSNDRCSLLERFYQATNNNTGHWSNLFNYVGRILSNTREQLDQEQQDKIIAFFDWRVSVKEPTELEQFAFWLQAECLEAEWRLEAFSKILDICKAEDVSIAIELEALCEMLPDYTAKVVECFAKLTDGHGDDNVYIRTEEAKTILKAGLASPEQDVHENAKRAQDNLLNVGRFELLELED